MSWMIQIVDAIPETVLVALVASSVSILGTLLGVHLTSRHHDRQQEKQNVFLRAQKQDEFKASLRHSTYLSAAAELVNAQTFLVNMGNLSADEWNANESLTTFGKVINQAILVADDETAILLTDVLSAYERAFFNLVEMVVPIQDVLVRRNLHNEMVERHTSEVARLTQALVKNAEQPVRNVEEWEAIQKVVTITQTLQQSAISELEGAAAELQTLRGSYMTKAMAESRSVAGPIVAALVAVRRELGLSTDENALRERVEERYRQSFEDMNKFVSRFQARSIGDRTID